jgi:tetratricopeptide (TPR) repeat protein
LIKQSQTLTSGTAISITKQICEGLIEAHRLGVVHRDLKPSNIMIDKQGNARIMDFGLARSLKEEGITRRGIMIGTPHYMSPEQVEGDDIDQRSDIYSMGVILYEMLTGTVPFRGDTALSIAHKHKYEAPQDPKEINAQIPDYLDHLILKCLEKDKEKRYQNVEELLEDLERHKEIAGLLYSRPRRVTRTAVISAISLIFITALVFFLWQGRKKPIISSLPENERISVAVMYFENNTGDENLDHWRIGLQDLLMTDLAQSKYLRVLPSDRLSQIIKGINQLETEPYSSQFLDNIASEENIKFFILGAYGKADNNYRITVKIKEIRAREFLATKIVEGKGEGSLHSIVDEITPWIKSELNLTPNEIAEDFDREIGKIITSSPEALRFYVEGKTYFTERKFEEGVEALKKAVAIDPEFAMAYSLLAGNYGYLGYVEEEKKYLKKAQALLDRVSLRERYFIEAEIHVLENSPQKAIENYQELLKIYPDDTDGIAELGGKYRFIEEWDLALEQFEKLIKTAPKTTYSNLVYIFMAKGEYEKAKAILEERQSLFPNNTYFNKYLAIVFFCQGKCDSALIKAQDALSLETDNYTNALLIGNIHHVKGDFLKAEEFYKKLFEIDEPDSQIYGRLALGHLYLSQGDYDKCLDEIVKGIVYSRKSDLKLSETELILFLTYLNLRLNRLTEALDTSSKALETASETAYVRDQILALNFSGIAYLKMRKLDEAKKTAAQLKQVIEKTGIRKHMRYYYHLMGLITREEKLISQSIDNFENALALLPNQKYNEDDQAIFYDALAFTFYNSGERENARSYYEKIISLTTGRFQYGDIYARSFYMLGKIYQEKGWAGKSIDQYEKFLNLWKAADSDIPEKADAEKQLMILRKES